MISKVIVLQNRGGLHARPATFFVQLANKFQCSIHVRFNDKETNGKSIIALMTLGAGQGKEITVVTDGVDEQAAMDEISAYLQQVEG